MQPPGARGLSQQEASCFQQMSTRKVHFHVLPFFWVSWVSLLFTHISRVPPLSSSLRI